MQDDLQNNYLIEIETKIDREVAEEKAILEEEAEHESED
jgi:hypothetical protein